jgi:hypothetical protein
VIPRWRYWQFYAHEPPDHLAFVYKKHYAYVNWDNGEYDYLPDFDDGVPQQYMPDEVEEKLRGSKSLGQRYREYWFHQVPEENRSWYVELRIIPYERILAIDNIGDFYYQKPHLIVEYERDGQPFTLNKKRQFIETDRGQRGNYLDVMDGKHISYFPSEIPEITPNLEV